MTETDLIAVRSDERFDTRAVAAYLAERLDDASGTLSVQQFAGGHANLTYLLTLEGGTEYVLRRPPLGPVAPGSHDMSREHRVLKDLWRAFPPAPRSHLFCDDDAIIGAPFLIMERKHGIVVRKQVPEIFGGGLDPASNR